MRQGGGERSGVLLRRLRVLELGVQARQGSERLNLLVHVLEPLVRLAQVLMRGHGVLRNLERARYVQHVVAEQLVHAGQGLRGLRAVQQHLRFLAADAQLGTEAVGKHGVLLRERHAGGLVLRLQLAFVQGVLQQRHKPVHVHLAGEDAVERFHLRFLLLARV